MDLNIPTAIQGTAPPEADGEIVLLVNDVPDQLDWMSTLLSVAGYEAHTAGSADEAFGLAGTLHPTLIVSDVSMPMKNGIELCRMIRSDEVLKSTPVLLFSAIRKDSESVLVGLRAGANDYLEAPCPPELLLAKVAQLVISRKAELALARSEDMYRDLVEHGNELICIHDLEGRILSVNPWAAKVLGIEQEVLLGSNISDVMTPEARRGLSNYLRRIRQDGSAKGMMLVQTAAGETRFWEYHNTLRTEGVETPVVRGMAHDVTNIKRAEESLRKSVERFELVTRATNDTIWDWDMLTGRHWWSENFQSMFLYGPDEVGADFRSWESRVHPADYDRVVGGIKALVESGGKTWADEYRFRRGDGEYAIVIDRGFVVRDEAGVPVRMVGSMGDVTERRRGEEQVRFQANALAQVRDAIVATDPEHRITYWNAGAERIYGVGADDALGRKLTDVYGYRWLRPGDEQQAHESLRASGAWSGCNVHTKRDGEEIHVESSVSVLKGEGGANSGLLAVIRDVTERKRVNAALRESESRYRGLIEALPAIVYVAEPDPPYATIYVNLGITTLGYTTEEWFNTPDLWVRLLHPDDRERVLRETQEAMSARRPNQYEYRMVTRGGEVRWFFDRGSFVVDERGARTAWQGVIIDVTDSKRAREELDHFFDLSGDLLGIAGFDGFFKRVNPAWERTLGYTLDELTGRPFLEFVHPEDHETTVAEMAKLAGGENTIAFENRYRCKDGSYRWLLWTSTPSAEHGLIYAVAHDITKRKQDEEERTRLLSALRAERERFGDIFSLAPAFITTMRGPDHVFEVTNPAYRRLIADRDVIGRPVREAFPELEGQGYFDLLDRVYRTGEPFVGTEMVIETRAECGRPPRRNYIDVVYMPMRDDAGAVSGILSHGVDVTEQVQARLRLQESQKSYEDLVENANDVIYTHDLEGNFRSLNRAGEALLGYSREEAPRTNLKDIVAPAYLMKARRSIAEKLDGEEKRTTYELVVKAKDGRAVTLEVSSRLMMNGGVPVGVQGIARDVTERKQAEERLLRISYAVESTNDAIGISDRERRSIYHNAAAVALLRYTPEELNAAGGPTALYADEDTAAGVWEILQAGGSRSCQTEIVSMAGERIPVTLSASAIRDEKGEIIGYIAIWTDMRERLQLEEQLRQSQRMEAVGRLAGGIAHDFNNLLTAITGYSELSLRRLGEEDPLYQNIREIKRAGERAVGLTRQLLAFSRKQILQPKVINLNEVIGDMSKMLRRLIGEDVELRAVQDMHLGLVKADPGQVEQVLMNLAVNARDAMPQGGELTLGTKNVEMDEEVAHKYASVRPGPHVLLTVADTGHGMDEETMSHVFEPFFTTKEVGRGTGLGLSTVYGIVKQSGGYIAVESEVGRGTTFKIYLPRVADPHHDAPVEKPEEVRSGREVLLLVEDEAVVRDLSRTILERFGYTVLTSDNGLGAIAICESHPGPIHLLLTDVVMPGMGGRALAEQAALLRPSMKVMYMSGYTDDSIVHHGVLDEGTSFLHKPFTPDALARKVREVLDGHAEG